MQEIQKNRELVSALADGQLREEEFARTVESVCHSDDLRMSWHAYHLVGDVLRSGETMAGAHDAAFVQRLKLSLARESRHAPEMDAPDLIAVDALLTRATRSNGSEDLAANDSRFRWKLLAGLASLAAVSVIGWQASTGWGDQNGAGQLAQVPVQSGQPEVVLRPLVAVAEPQVMIRDPQLDALLAAHRQFGGTSALQMPAGFLRNATFDGADR
ncbi:MAG: sigma-E factor negative regulatory protein [Rhodoferax sp.]|nr:sigma-E factor negative regulatory protein [Rhodoferax sp.]